MNIYVIKHGKCLLPFFTKSSYLQLTNVSLCRSYSHCALGNCTLWWKSCTTSYLLNLKTFCTYYKILEVSSDADTKAIKEGYYAKCKKLHPDVIQGRSYLHEDFVKVQKAYETLKVESTRKEYDNYLKSVDRSSHDFVEWKAYIHHHHSSERDYSKYKTGQGSGSGLDAKWSDFTFVDVLVLFLLLGIIIYIFYNEKNMLNQNVPAYHKRHTHFDHTITAQSVKSAHTNTAKHSASFDSVTSANSNASQKQDTPSLTHSHGIFHEINSTASVSEKTIEQIKNKYKDMPNTEHGKRDLNTWGKTS